MFEAIFAASVLAASAQDGRADPVEDMTARTEAVQIGLNPSFRGMGQWTAAEFSMLSHRVV